MITQTQTFRFILCLAFYAFLVGPAFAQHGTPISSTSTTLGELSGGSILPETTTTPPASTGTAPCAPAPGMHRCEFSIGITTLGWEWERWSLRCYDSMGNEVQCSSDTSYDIDTYCLGYMHEGGFGVGLSHDFDENFLAGLYQWTGMCFYWYF